jgi:hypothetical protein
MQSDSPCRFVVLTCREPLSDFREPLVEALRRDYETYYIWLRRRPLVSGPGNGDPPREMALGAFLAFVRRLRDDRRAHFYFNSTNTYFPGLTVLLRAVAPRGVWCLDMHDDLRYHNTGLKRITEGLIISLLQACSDVTVHAAPTLAELFPRSRHLGNASHILPLPLDTAEPDAVLVIASFDARFDFDFLSDVAALSPNLAFHLYGWTRRDDPDTQRQLGSLPARHANVHYHGPYTIPDLPGILARYRVSVAPYRAGSLLTRYIDPLRFYHCLNAGLEVVSTDIPQARYMRDHIHVASDAAGCARILEDIRAGRLARQPGYQPVTWTQRALRLTDILFSLPKARALLARRQRPLT